MLHGIKGRAEAASILSDQGLTSLLQSLASTLPPLTSTSELFLSAGAQMLVEAPGWFCEIAVLSCNNQFG